jgi:hypothetical protein
VRRWGEQTDAAPAIIMRWNEAGNLVRESTVDHNEIRTKVYDLLSSTSSQDLQQRMRVLLQTPS